MWLTGIVNIVMERDLRITGTERGQSNNHQAPKGFEVNNPWKVWTINLDVYGNEY